MNLLFKMTPTWNAEVLSSFPKHRRFQYSLWRNVCGKLCSGKRDHTVGCEFNVNESRIHAK